MRKPHIVLLCALIVTLAGCSGLRNGNGLISNKAIKGPICVEDKGTNVIRVYSC